MDPTGAYTAERAAALSGVPRSTIHYWARKGVLAPAVSSERVKLWSYADLMAMRIIYWLRQRKTDADGAEIPPTGMLAVRRAIGHLERLDIPLWHSEGKSAIWVTGDGEIHIRGSAARTPSTASS